MSDLDHLVRLAAFAFLTEQARLHEDVMPRDLLTQGFVFEGRRVPLLSQQGIFKPAILPEVPLSIRTAAPDADRPRPYDDALDSNGLLRYCYRGTNPQHHENRGLRLAMTRRVPLIYFHGIVPGRYMASWPVYIVGDDPAALLFTVAVDDRGLAQAVETAIEDAEANIRRRYITRQTTQRLHQLAFRHRVLRAYREHCAICRLRHEELLEAAHILPDGHPKGEPVVANGLALCKLHHAAFDANILGITPEYRVDLRLDILEETDGPMLRHGLQGFQRALIWTPHAADQKPKPEFLEERYALFKKAS
jgi:putative restriction endonuclease